MLPDPNTGDGLPRAGSVQSASRRFSQNSLYRHPLGLSSRELRCLKKGLCSQGNVCKAISPLALMSSPLVGFFRAGTQSCCPKNPDQRQGLKNSPSSEGGGAEGGSQIAGMWGLVRNGGFRRHVVAPSFRQFARAWDVKIGWGKSNRRAVLKKPRTAFAVASYAESLAVHRRCILGVLVSLPVVDRN
jgi:hypothetical protein